MQLEKNQQQLVKHQFQSLVQLQLEAVDDLFQSHFQRLETALQGETRILLSSKDNQYSTETLRGIVKSSPYIEQVFILDQQRDTLFPLAEHATQQELRFLQQANTLLTTQNLFSRKSETPSNIALVTTPYLSQNEQQAPSPKRSTPAPYNAQLKQKVSKAPLPLSSEHRQKYSSESAQANTPSTNPVNTNTPTLAMLDQERAPADDISPQDTFTAAIEDQTRKYEPTDTGWIAWYNNTQLQHIYWQTTPDNEVIGFAINSARLLSDLINLLPDQNQVNLSEQLKNASIYLKNSRGDISYEWGNIEILPNSLKPIKAINLSHPLGSWRLEYISPTLTPTKENWLEKLLIIALTLTTLSLLGWLIYREQTRESRLALQRVNFVNQVSHELKTPLTNVRMYAEMLETHLDDDQKKPKRYLDVINTESQRLSRLIDNVLSFSRLERDNVELCLQQGSVDTCIRNTLQAFAPALAQKGLDPLFTSHCPSKVLIDPHCTEQILNNLLSNIEKYAANSGSINIECWHENEISFIRVHDNGPGIDLTSSSQIFNQFYRASNKLTDGVTGTGIGLSIARELARKHGGDLLLEPSEQGACFLLSLHTPPASNTHNEPNLS